MAARVKTAILISGSGTTMEAVLQASQQHKLAGIVPTVVISSKASASGVEKAKKYGIPTFVVERKKHLNLESFGQALLRILKKFEIDLVSQNGWLPLTPAAVVDAYSGMIINQHPVPLDPGRPDFGGKGMYGERAQAARLAYLWMSGEKWWAESTVHLVMPKYDEGLLLGTMQLPLMDVPRFKITARVLSKNDEYQQQLRELTAKAQSQLFPVEYENVINTLRQFGTGKPPRAFSRPKPLIKSKHHQLLISAKQIATDLFDSKKKFLLAK